MIELFSYEFMVRAFIAAVLISIAAGLIGPFLVLRKLSLLGDGLAHLAFGGVALGFLLNISPSLSALAVVIVGSLVVKALLSKNIYGDALIAVILSFGVGVGVLIIGATDGFGVNLFSYLLGSVLTTTWIDIWTLVGLLILIIGCFAFFWREFFLLTFQTQIAKIASQKTKIADYVFTILIALVTFMAIQIVGILLISVLLVIPALIAIRLANSFRQTLIMSVLLNVVMTLVGITLSFYLDVPPSGLISVMLLALFFTSLLK